MGDRASFRSFIFPAFVSMIIIYVRMYTSATFTPQLQQRGSLVSSALYARAAELYYIPTVCIVCVYWLIPERSANLTH